VLSLLLLLFSNLERLEGARSLLLGNDRSPCKPDAGLDEAYGIPLHGAMARELLVMMLCLMWRGGRLCGRGEYLATDGRPSPPGIMYFMSFDAWVTPMPSRAGLQ